LTGEPNQRADGSEGGPRIDAELGTPDFIRLYGEATAAKKKNAKTFSSLIDYFKDQSEYTGLGAKSKRAYDQYLALIEAKFGAMPVAAIEDRRARGDFKAFRNTFASTPRKANYAWATIVPLSILPTHPTPVAALGHARVPGRARLLRSTDAQVV
jgi:hypothetical protein